MAVEQKRFSRRREMREARNPTGEPRVAPEVPELDALDIGAPEQTQSEPEEDLSADLEHPPGPAVMWQRIRSIEKKMDILWLRRENERRGGGSLLTTWRCKGSPDRPGHACDAGPDGTPFVMESTPPGMPKSPELICPKHGRVPFDPLS